METYDCIIAIDPGKSNGGIVVEMFNRNLKAIKMPKDTTELLPFFQYYRDCSDNPIAFIEKQGYRHSDFDKMKDNPEAKGIAFGLQALMQNFHEVCQLLSLAKIPYVRVAPQTWRASTGCNKGCPKDKTAKMQYYRKQALLYYPGTDKLVTNNTAAALLILQCAKHKIKNEPAWIQQQLPKPLQSGFVFNPKA